MTSNAAKLQQDETTHDGPDMQLIVETWNILNAIYPPSRESDLHDIRPYVLNNQLGNMDSFLKLGRGSVLVEAQGEGSCSLGLLFHSSLLSKMSPTITITEEWTAHSLDVFLVVIEELSHFLLISRSENLSELSRVKLEVQAEIDKILVCALLQSLQIGRANWKGLVDFNFERQKTFGKEHPDFSVYNDANSIAARFWESWVQHLKPSFHPALHPDGIVFLEKLQTRPIDYTMRVTEDFLRIRNFSDIE